MIKLILCSLLCLFVAPQNFETLLSKEWRTRYIEEAGRKTYPDGGEVNDRFIFNVNHTVEIIEAGESQDGIWQYDPATKRLVISNRVNKDKLTMSVITLTRDELVLKLMDNGEGNALVYLVPVR